MEGGGQKAGGGGRGGGEREEKEKVKEKVKDKKLAVNSERLESLEAFFGNLTHSFLNIHFTSIV